VYDKYERLCFVDHLVSKKITINDFSRQRKLKTLSDDIYKGAFKERENAVNLNYHFKNKNLEFTKRINLKTRSSFVAAKYKFVKKDLLEKYDFAVEFNLFFQSAEDVVLYFKKQGFSVEEKKVFQNINKLEIEDKFKGIRTAFKFDNAKVFAMPIYSITNSIGSESQGAEKMFQEISILFIKKNKKDFFNIAIQIGNNNDSVS